MSNVHFHIGEVVAIPEVNTYNFTSKNRFEIAVQTYTNYYDPQTVYAIPLNNNITQIPLIGEHVLLVKSLPAKNLSDEQYEQWYYIASFSVLSDVNSNAVLGVAKFNSTYSAPTTFTRRNTAFIQPYEGDIIVEGRFGNTIRLGSTVNTISERLPATWRGNSGDPIIVLANTLTSNTGSYVVEGIDTSASSLHLTSTQTLSTLLLGDSNNRNPLTRFTPSETQYKQSQFIGAADRVVLKAKTDIAVIDSPRGIVLNTTGDVKIGSDDAAESMVHGDVLLEILQNIILQMRSGLIVGDTYAPAGGYANGASYAQRAQELLQELLSSRYFIKKQTY